MPRWKEYEKVVTRIYQELEPFAVVTHNDKIIGRDSKIERQIDVSIKTKIAGHEILIIVQAKNYKKPADVNTIGELASVINDVGASKGILVCNVGFTDGAIGLAKSLGIDLCSAHDAESRDWKEDLKIPVLWIDISPIVNIQILVFLNVGDSISKDPQDWVLSTDRGATRLTIFKTFVDLWNNDKIPKDIDKTHILKGDNSNIELLVAENKWQPVDDLALVYTVNRKAWLKYFTPIEFRGIRNYVTGDVNFSRMKLGIKPFARDDGWIEIIDPDSLIIETKGIIVTAENPTISLDGVEIYSLNTMLLQNGMSEL